MNLSAHVTLAEFENSPTATTHGINNKMNESQIASAKLLCENVFEPLRIHLNTPIKISSGYRSPQLNKIIKGSLSSQHCKAEAMDIKVGAKGFNFIKDKSLTNLFGSLETMKTLLGFTLVSVLKIVNKY